MTLMDDLKLIEALKARIPEGEFNPNVVRSPGEEFRTAMFFPEIQEMDAEVRDAAGSESVECAILLEQENGYRVIRYSNFNAGFYRMEEYRKEAKLETAKHATGKRIQTRFSSYIADERCDFGFENAEGVPVEGDEDRSAVEEATEYLYRQGASFVDETKWAYKQGDRQPATQFRTDLTYHFHGFTEDEERQIREALGKRRRLDRTPAIGP